MADRSIVVRLRAEIAGYKAAMADAAKSAKQVGDEAQAAALKSGKSDKEAAKAAREAAKAARERRAAWDDLSSKAMVGGLALAAGIGVAVSRFAEFDAAMSAVQANSGATGAELDALRQAAIDLGADSQFSAKEAAEGINELAKAGVSAGDILGGGLKGSLDLAAAGQISVGEAAETAATAMTQFNLEGGEIPHVADLLTNAANKAQGGVGDLAAALKQGGLVAASTGLTIDETTASLAAFASAGLVGSDAGTSLKTMLQRLSAPSGEAARLMEELGISAYDASGEFVGMEALSGQLQTSLSGLTSEQRNSALATIFGSDAVRAANILYAEGADGIAKWTDEVTEQGAAAKQAAILNDNLKGDIERLGGALDSVFIQTGGSANGALRTLTQGLTGLVDHIGGIPGPVLLAGSALASLALVGPKAVTSFQDYRANLDSLGLSMDKMSKKAPRTAQAITGVGKALGGLAIAGTAIGIMQDELGSIGSEQLIRDLEGSASALDTINAAIAKADGGTSDVQDLGSALRVAFDPNFIDEAGAGIDGFFSVFGVDKTGEIAMSTARLKELDSTMSQMVASGNAEGARSMMAAIEAEAKRQGISVDDLREKFPLLAEAYAAAENSGDGLNEGMSETEQAAADAEAAIDDLKTTLEMLGGGFRAEQAASRAVTDSLKEMQDVVKSGEGGWSALSASMEKAAGDALSYASAQVEMGRGSDEIAAGIARAREQIIQSGVDSGKSRAFMEDYADAIGLIPSEAKTMVEAAGVTESTAEVLALDASIVGLDGKVVTVKEEGANPSKGRVMELDGAIFGLDGKTVKVQEIGATASGDRVVRFRGEIYKLSGKTVNVHATTSGMGSLQAMSNTIAAMNSKNITIGVTTRYTVAGRGGGGVPMNADGGLYDSAAGFGLVRRFADGGWAGTLGQARPQIRAAGGAGVLWAEDGAGPWEAFISGHPAKKDRSRHIWLETGKRLGLLQAYADGGMHATRQYVAPPVAPRVVVQTAAGTGGPVRMHPADIEALADAMARRPVDLYPSQRAYARDMTAVSERWAGR